MFKNAEPLRSLSLAPSSREGPGAVPAPRISGVEIKAESVCICFIDDCMDCDVPLAELTFSRECHPDIQFPWVFSEAAELFWPSCTWVWVRFK